MPAPLPREPDPSIQRTTTLPWPCLPPSRNRHPSHKQSIGAEGRESILEAEMPGQFALDEQPGLGGRGAGEEALDRRMLLHPPGGKEHHVVGQAGGLAQVVGGHDDLGALRADFPDDALHRLHGGRIEAGGRLGQEEQARAGEPMRPNMARARARRSRRVKPRGLRARPTLASTESRSIMGCWKTIATPEPGPLPNWSPQATEPSDGRSSPHIIRSSTLLPEPLGPKRRSRKRRGNRALIRSAPPPRYAGRRPGR